MSKTMAPTTQTRPRLIGLKQRSHIHSGLSRRFFGKNRKKNGILDFFRRKGGDNKNNDNNKGRNRNGDGENNDDNDDKGETDEEVGVPGNDSKDESTKVPELPTTPSSVPPDVPVRSAVLPSSKTPVAQAPGKSVGPALSVDPSVVKVTSTPSPKSDLPPTSVAAVETVVPTVAPPQAVELPPTSVSLSNTQIPSPTEVPALESEDLATPVNDQDGTPSTIITASTGAVQYTKGVAATSTNLGTSLIDPKATGVPTVKAVPPTISIVSADASITSTSMSPVAARLLTAAGVIGGFIILLAIIYFTIRVRHKEFLKRKSKSLRDNVWPSRRKQGQLSPMDSAPQYTGEKAAYSLPSEPGIISSSRKTITVVENNSTLAEKPQTTVVQHQNSQPTVVGPKPVGSRPGRVRSKELPLPPLSTSHVPRRNDVVTKIIPAPHLNTGNHFHFIPGTYSPSDYNNTGTQNTFLTKQTSNINGPDIWGPNRMSELSSLSSGFGDGLIISEGEIMQTGNKRQSRAKTTSTFSWQTSRTSGRKSRRFSNNTTASSESAPRFRSISSWVAQQSGRIEKSQRIANDAPEVPALPTSMPTKEDHRRKVSEISAFQYHPGEKIILSPGRRVPSTILDKKMGHTAWVKGVSTSRE